MKPSDPFRSLAANDWDQLQDRADRLEQAWQSGADVELDSLLPQEGDPLRTVVLHELIKTDLEIRWRRGLNTDLSHYLDKFPELGGEETLPAQLVYEEYRVRQRFGDQPALDTYRTRFPRQFADLQRLLEEQPVQTVQKAEVTAPLEPSHPSAAPLASGSDLLSVGGGYRMIRRIGSGGFGEVWLAEAPGGVEAAVKIIFRPLDHEEAKRELQSLELIKRLRHPFLLQTQLFQPLADRLYIVMELADGSLRDRLKECRREGQAGIPLAEMVTYLREAAEALDYLHSEHVLHRDIKPDNILLLKRHAKVADFGLARLQDSTRLASVSGSGTPAYMAPEVWRGKANERSDQYSLAMTYAELRLDRRIFTGKDMMEIMLDHTEREPDLVGLAEAERKVILKAMAKNPEQRYRSCLEFVQALQQALGQQGTQSTTGIVAASSNFSPGAGPTGGFDTARSTAVTETAEGVDRASGWRQKPRKSKMILMIGLLAVLLAVGGTGIVLGLKYLPHSPEITTEKTADHPDDIGPDVLLPVKWKRVEGSKVVSDMNGKSYVQRIICPVPEGPPVVFVLVPQQSASDPPTFYLMENKVTNDLFKRFVERHPGAVRSNAWQLGADADGQDLTSANPQLPVLRITVTEAHQCARWLGGLLPTVQQWDRAAGYPGTNDRAGPYSTTSDRNAALTVNRRKQGPRPVDQATSDDESPFGIKDMAGNGREFTRNLLNGSSVRHVPIPNPHESDLVILRGRSYAATKLLTNEDLKYQQEMPQTQYYHSASPYTGFRVVLELRQ